MESQGIVLNESESIPSDPYTIRRAQAQQTHVIPYDHNHQLERFLTLDRQVHTHTHTNTFESLSLIISLLTPGSAFLCALGRLGLTLWGETACNVVLLSGGWFCWNLRTSWGQQRPGPIPSAVPQTEDSQKHQINLRWDHKHKDKPALILLLFMFIEAWRK